MQYALYRSIPCLHSICSHKHNDSSAAPLIARYHLPSAEKLWQIPQAFELPRDPFIPFLSTPLDVHATSYFAASARIRSFSCIDSPCLNSISFTSIISFIIHEYMFGVNLFRTFVRIIVSGVCRACLRKLLSDTKYEKNEKLLSVHSPTEVFLFSLVNELM